MTSHIPTLLLREWMQHKRGWLIAAFALPALCLAMLPFGGPQDKEPMPHAELIGLVALLVSAAAVYVICLTVGLFQLPGLARRDVQDRSIEFWLSLPGRPSESVAATVLAHAWLAPVGGAVVGALFGLPIAMAVLASQGGLPMVAAVDWREVLSAGLPLLARGLAGTVLLLLWLSPLIFTLMAASAWLKRLGVPVVLVGGTVLVSVLHKLYAIDWPLEALLALHENISRALVGAGVKDAVMSEPHLWAWALHDFGDALARLASPAFVGWMAVSAAGFALVVMKRARGG